MSFPIHPLLMTGLQNRVLCIAEEYGIVRELADAYHSAVAQEVQELLRCWGYSPWGAPLPELSIREVTEQLYLLDSDKVLYVQVATDNLSEPSVSNHPAGWDIARLGQDLEHRNSSVVSHLSSLGMPKDRLMTLTILQSCRQMDINDPGLPTSDTIRLIMSASHLKAIALVDSEDHLALWKYGRSHHWVRDSAVIVSTNPLDEYAFYRRNPMGYHLPDEAAPFLVIMPAGAGLEIIQEVHERLDPHLVPSYLIGQLTEVWGVSGDGIPISTLPFSSQTQMPLVVSRRTTSSSLGRANGVSK